MCRGVLVVLLFVALPVVEAHLDAPKMGGHLITSLCVCDLPQLRSHVLVLVGVDVVGVVVCVALGVVVVVGGVVGVALL